MSRCKENYFSMVCSKTTLVGPELMVRSAREAFLTNTSLKKITVSMLMVIKLSDQIMMTISHAYYTIKLKAINRKIKGNYLSLGMYFFA